MFMHGDIMHLAFNMFSLYMFGLMVEMTWNQPFFILLSLLWYWRLGIVLGHSVVGTCARRLRPDNLARAYAWRVGRCLWYFSGFA